MNESPSIHEVSPHLFVWTDLNPHMQASQHAPYTKHLFLGCPISQLARAWNQAPTEARVEGFWGRLWKTRWAVPLPSFSPHRRTEWTPSGRRVAFGVRLLPEQVWVAADALPVFLGEPGVVPIQRLLEQRRQWTRLARFGRKRYRRKKRSTFGCASRNRSVGAI